MKEKLSEAVEKFNELGATNTKDSDLQALEDAIADVTMGQEIREEKVNLEGAEIHSAQEALKNRKAAIKAVHSQGKAKQSADIELEKIRQSVSQITGSRAGMLCLRAARSTRSCVPLGPRAKMRNDWSRST